MFISAVAYQANTQANNKSKKYSQWTKQLTSAAQELYAKGLDRDDEFQADKMGIRLLAKAGYDPFAYIDNLQILAAISADDSSLALLYKTHPTPTSRLQELRVQLGALAAVDGKLLANRFKQTIN